MPKTAQGSRASALNRLSHGCNVEGVLPCKQENCVWAEGCRLDPYTRENGWPLYGDPCHLEQRELDAYILWARRLYAYAKQWLTDEEFEDLIHRLGLLRLRSRRVVQRLNHEGLVHYIELSNGQKLHREPIASRRYLASVNHQRDKIMERLAEEPSTKAEKARRAKMKRIRDREARDQEIALLMIRHRYFRPYEGEERLDLSKAPEWILRMVDEKFASTRGDHNRDN